MCASGGSVNEQIVSVKSRINACKGAGVEGSTGRGRAACSATAAVNSRYCEHSQEVVFHILVGQQLKLSSHLRCKK